MGYPLSFQFWVWHWFRSGGQGLLILILLEEDALERGLGDSYREFKKHVKGRIIPGLPI